MSKIKPKPKPCKGTTNDTKGYGCGEHTLHRVYGLCKMKCYPDWLLNTEPGRLKLEKAALKIQKNKKKSWNQEKAKIRKSLETKSDLEKKLQKEINFIVRLLDKGHECISSGRPLGKSYDAGHLYTVGGNPTLRFNLFNIFAQSVHDNQHKSGNELEYFLRLEELFGKDFQNYVLSLKQCDALHLTKEELREKITIARGIVKRLKKEDIEKYSMKERLEMRSKINLELGIYDKKFCEFKNG